MAHAFEQVGLAVGRGRKLPAVRPIEIFKHDLDPNEPPSRSKPGVDRRPVDPASSGISRNALPAGPTKGLPCAASSTPGASPTT